MSYLIVSETVAPWFLNHGFKIVIILIIAFVLEKISCSVISRAIRVTVRSNHFRNKEEERQRENTLTQIFTWTARILILVVALLMILPEIGIAIGPVLASVGIVGLALGFGGQYLIRDIISGLFIILENQYRIGDVVDFDGTSGEVTRITLRMTTLKDMDGNIHHVPHGEIKKVTNMTKDFSKVNLNIGVAYETDLEQLEDVINTVGLSLTQDPDWQEKLLSAPKFLRVQDFADNAIIVKIVADTQPTYQWAITGEIRKRLKIAFDRAGIQMPYPQRVIHVVPAAREAQASSNDRPNDSSSNSAD